MTPAIEVEHLGGEGAPVVLLHAGVADRRSWHGVAPLIAGAVHAYDRRGFGSTPPSAEPFTHLDDLLGIVRGLGDDPAWLVGNSMGGALAVDAALAAPDQVAGLVLIAPAISGEPEPDTLDDDTARLAEELDAAVEAGDLEALNRLEARLWLDGPAQPEGRVGGPARDLFLEMNGIALANDVPDDAGASGLDAWSRLDEIRTPTTILCGAFDVPFLRNRCAELARRIPGARAQELPAVAHLPSLERPDELAAAVNDAIARG